MFCRPTTDRHRTSFLPMAFPYKGHKGNRNYKDNKGSAPGTPAILGAPGFIPKHNRLPIQLSNFPSQLEKLLIKSVQIKGREPKIIRKIAPCY